MTKSSSSSTESWTQSLSLNVNVGTPRQNPIQKPVTSSAERKKILHTPNYHPPPTLHSLREATPATRGSGRLTCSSLARAGIALSIWVEGHNVHRIGCVWNQPLQVHCAGISWYHNLRGEKTPESAWEQPKCLESLNQHTSIYYKRLNPDSLEANCIFLLRPQCQMPFLLRNSHSKRGPFILMFDRFNHLPICVYDEYSQT